MTGKETVETIITDIKNAKGDGINQIDVNNLLKYLEGFITNEGYSHDFQLETLKASHQINVEAFKANTIVQIESFKSVITVGANAARAILIINGGAAIALLAFLGNIWEKTSEPNAVASIAIALLIFCGGVLASGFCSGFTYVAQFCYGKTPLEHNTSWEKWGNITNLAAVFCGIASLSCFAWGTYIAFISMGEQFFPS